MSWLFYALSAAFCIAAGQVFIKKGLAAFTPLWNTIIDVGFSLLLYIPFALLAGIKLPIPLSVIPLTIIIATLYIFFYYAIEKAEVSLSGTVFSLYPVVTVILAFLFLHERISVFQFMLIGLIIIGAILVSYEKGSLKQAAKNKSNWVVWALFAAAATGTGDFLAKGVLNQIDVSTYMFIFAVSFMISTFFFYIFDKKGRSLPEKMPKNKLFHTFIGTFLLSLGVLAISLAFDKGSASLVSAVSSSYVGITVLLAYFLLGERLTKYQLAGVILIIAGIAFLG